MIHQDTCRNRLTLRPLASVMLAMLAVLAFTHAALAKGPESIVISGPGIDQPMELLAEGNRSTISRLMEQSGLWYASGDLPRPISEPTGNLGPAYRIAWVNMGPPDKPLVERSFYQLYYPYAAGGPLIHTPYQDTLAGWGQERLGWAAAPDGLLDTLRQLGAPIADAPPTTEMRGYATASTIAFAAALLYMGLLIIIAVTRRDNVLAVR